MSTVCRAAGVVIYKMTESGPKILCLEALPRLKDKHRIYDIPKGKIDPGEDPFECAKRECFEETGIAPDKFIAGPYKSGGIWVWLSRNDQHPVLGVNPETLMKEHLGYKYLAPDDAQNYCLGYIRPIIVWARRVIENNDKV